MNILGKALAASIVMTMALPASATTYVFNTTGNMNDNGSYGNPLNFTSVTGNAHVKITGWQANSSSNAITSAYVGAYSPGTGVTGLGDYRGDYGYHQIDNAGGYTDFVLLQFDQAVNLTSLNLNSFLLGNNNSKDNDFEFAAVNVPAVAWNSNLDLSAYSYVGTLGYNAGDGSNRTAVTGANGYSNQWIVGAARNSNGNDGFKLAQLTVNSAVPEPGTWAMMLVGFGAMGGAMRYRRRKTMVAFA